MLLLDDYTLAGQVKAFCTLKTEEQKRKEEAKRLENARIGRGELGGFEAALDICKRFGGGNDACHRSEGERCVKTSYGEVK